VLYFCGNFSLNRSIFFCLCFTFCLFFPTHTHNNLLFPGHFCSQRGGHSIFHGIIVGSMPLVYGACYFFMKQLQLLLLAFILVCNDNAVASTLRERGDSLPHLQQKRKQQRERRGRPGSGVLSRPVEVPALALKRRRQFDNYTMDISTGPGGLSLFNHAAFIHMFVCIFYRF
jgi:hypothetical protein